MEIAEKPTHWRVVDGFVSDFANDLRAVYDGRTRDPLRVDPERFVWDYWHVPNQYTLLRTPAEDYFGAERYGELEKALLEYGRRELGCSAITPVWMSCYVHGMRQELHADVPHGPWVCFVVIKILGLRLENKKGQQNLLTFFIELKSESTDKPGSVVDNHSSRCAVTNAFKRPTRIQREPRL